MDKESFAEYERDSHNKYHNPQQTNSACAFCEEEGWLTKNEDTARYFKYTGEWTLTRGEYGVSVVGGHNTDDAPEHISVFDPDYGDGIWISIETGLASGDWVEVSGNEWARLTD